jgi:hypothetical protein
MAATIAIPNFNFGAFYYADILESLIQFKRENVPELTDESEFEPLIQFLRGFALVGHLNNVNIDILANESTIVTATLPEQIRNMLKLIDYDLRPASPAQVDLLYKLSQVFTSSVEVVSDQAQAATKKETGVDQLFYEANEALIVTRTDQVTYAYASDGGVFSDFTTQCNSAITPADDWTPWATPAVGDAFYIGHSGVLWNEMAITITTPMSGIVGVWEYYDGNFSKSVPDSVVDNGATLTLALNAYLGSTNKSGTVIRVKLNDTGAFEDAVSTWTGSENRVTIGLLGQSSPSTDVQDYTIGSDWEELSSIIDGTTSITVDGELEYTLPQTLTEVWSEGDVNNASAYWVRFRIVEVSVPVSPVFQRIRIDTGDQYVVRPATQGIFQQDNALGSSTGLPDQSFSVTKAHYINGTIEVTVDDVVWTEVDNFLSSAPSDQHYVVSLTDDDTAVITFGDGITGRIPPLGVNNIDASYRYGAESNGNTGAESITVDKTGLTYVNSITNPRPAQGWSQADSASPEALEQAKVLGPASLRVIHTAISPSDVITVTKLFTDEQGARPFSRAQAFEEGFGPKTLELVVVVKGGGQATQTQLDALSLYFNGDKYANPPVESHYVANQQVTAVNYTQRVIDIEAVVTGDVTPEAVRNALAKVIQPEALKPDGVTYEWQFGASVPTARISHEIFDTDESITNVNLIQPASDVVLTKRELPVLGNVNITVV